MEDTERMNKAFGLFIKNRRLAMNITQSELGEMLGIKQSTVAHYESGRRAVYLPTILALEVALRFRFDDFHKAYDKSKQ